MGLNYAWCQVVQDYFYSYTIDFKINFLVYIRIILWIIEIFKMVVIRIYYDAKMNEVTVDM